MKWKATMKENPDSIEHLTLSELQERGLEHRISPTAVKKNKGGRPKEKIDKRNQFSLTYWFRLLQKDFKKLRPIQRSRIALDCWKTLINKSNSIPQDPEDSKVNASQTMEVLRGLEVGLESAPSGMELVKPVEESGELVPVGKTIESEGDSVASTEGDFAMVRPNPPSSPTITPTKKMEMPLPCPADAPQTNDSPSI